MWSPRNDFGDIRRLHLTFSADLNKRDNVWKTQIPFQSDVSSAVAVVDDKAPYLIDQSVRFLTNHDDEFRLRRRYFSTLVLHHLGTSHVVHKTYRRHCIKQQLILHVGTLVAGC